MPAALRISQTVEAPTGCPSRASSPWIRRCPHRGFSLARCRTSFLIAEWVAWASDSAAVCGVVQFGGDELAVPGEQRGWGVREGVAPSASRYESRQCGEPEAIGCFVADGA